MEALHIYRQRKKGTGSAATDGKSVHWPMFNPGHPDADEDGYLLKPNVDLVVETTNMLMARRVFEANVAAMKSVRQMVLKALEIGR